jgi:hypothetical protein
VHRDFKPSNVILTEAGPKVIDFGIAQALDATSMTRTGMMVGSAGVIQQVAVNGNHAVALGQQTTAHGVQPLAERSDDGGRSWQPVAFTAPGPGVSFTALTGGSGGFTAAARFSSAGGALAAAVWTSADGANWTRSPVSGLTGGGSHAITALAASGTAVTAIDSVQTQASQQFVVRRLPSG